MNKTVKLHPHQEQMLALFKDFAARQPKVCFLLHAPQRRLSTAEANIIVSVPKPEPGARLIVKHLKRRPQKKGDAK